LLQVIGLLHTNGDKGSGPFHALQLISVVYELVYVDGRHFGAIETGDADSVC